MGLKRKKKKEKKKRKKEKKKRERMWQVGMAAADPAHVQHTQRTYTYCKSYYTIVHTTKRSDIASENT